MSTRGTAQMKRATTSTSGTFSGSHGETRLMSFFEALCSSPFSPFLQARRALLLFLVMTLLSPFLEGRATAAPGWKKKSYWRQRARLWRQRLKVKKLHRREGSLLDTLESLDRQRIAIMAKRQLLKKKSKALKVEIKLAQAQVSLQKEIYLATQKKMQPRLRLFYRVSRLGHARWLLGTRSLKEMALRWSAIRLMTARDIKLLKEYQLMRRVIALSFQQLKQKQQALSRLVEQLGQQTRQMLMMRKEKQVALEALYKEARLFRKVLREARGAGKLLTKMLKGLGARTEIHPLQHLRGRLPWPIKGFSSHCHRYQLKWIASIAQLQCHDWRKQETPWRGPLGRTGITLRIPEGTPVHAVAAGRIVYQGWMRGYGNLLLIDHGARFHTLYAHLSQFAFRKGDSVRVGQPIGLSGATGTLGKAALYFELRHMARSEKPELWLEPLPSPFR